MLTGLTGRAMAAEPLTPIRIAYSAPASCPDALTLVAHVQARTARARVALPDETALELAVRVDKTKGLFRGRLVVGASTEAARQEREVTDASCDELIEALGFFVALAVDGRAKSEAPPPMPAPTPAPMQAQPEIEPLAAVIPAPPTPTRSPDRVAEQRHESPWHFGGGAGPALVFGVAPETAIASRFFVDVSRERAGDSIVAPFVSVGAVSTATSSDSTPLGDTALRWQSLVATLSPVAVPLFTNAELRPCAVLEVGRLRGEGIGITNARRTEADWVGIGLSGQFELRLLPRLFVALEVGASVPVVRPRFEYSSGVTAFRPAELGGRMSLSFAARL